MFITQFLSYLTKYCTYTQDRHTCVFAYVLVHIFNTKNIIIMLYSLFIITACEKGTWGVGCQLCNCDISSCDAVIGCTSCLSPSFGGPDCTDHINVCASGQDVCSANSDCVDTLKAHQCKCRPWFAPVLDSCYREYNQIVLYIFFNLENTFLSSSAII